MSPNEPDELRWKVLATFSALARASHSILFSEPNRPGRQHTDLNYLDTFGTMEMPQNQARPVWKDDPITSTELCKHFTISGSFKNGPRCAQEIYARGISSSLRPLLWPYLLGVFGWKESKVQVENRLVNLREEYTHLKDRWESPKDLKTRGLAAERHRTIVKDVLRTDRAIPFYQGECKTNGTLLTQPNLNKIKDVLLTFCFYHTAFEYAQELCDLVSPILYVVQDEALTFWCLVNLVSKKRCLFDEHTVTRTLHLLAKLVRILIPDLYSFLDQKGVLRLLFCYRWIAVDFRRELPFEDVLKLWERTWANPFSSDYVLFVCLGFLNQCKSSILQSDTFEDLVSVVNQTLLDLKHVYECAEQYFCRFKYLMQFIKDPDLESINILGQTQ